MDKFYTGLGAKQKSEQELEEKKVKFPSIGNFDSRDSTPRVKTADFRDSHQKLFTRESHKKIEKKKTDESKATLFERFREDFSDPFESAKESGATVGQIRLINFSMFALG